MDMEMEMEMEMDDIDYEPEEKPLIYTFTFGSDWQQSQFQSIHGRLLNMLFERSTLRHAKDANQALALFSEDNEPRAVFVADAAIMAPRNEVISQRLVNYVKYGGTVVFGGMFSAQVERGELDRYFGHTWDLPWEAGSQHRTTLVLNETAVELPISDELSNAYSQKALFLHNVLPHECWYLPTEDSVVESFVPIPGPVTDFSETPVAFTRVGKGWLGYVGDMNAEEGSDAAVLGMMSMLI